MNILNDNGILMIMIIVTFKDNDSNNDSKIKIND